MLPLCSAQPGSELGYPRGAASRGRRIGSAELPAPVQRCSDSSIGPLRGSIARRLPHSDRTTMPHGGDVRRGTDFLEWYRPPGPFEYERTEGEQSQTEETSDHFASPGCDPSEYNANETPAGQHALVCKPLLLALIIKLRYGISCWSSVTWI